VEAYLAWYAEEGTKPQKTRLGKLTIRVDENLYPRLAVTAAAGSESDNAWITTPLDRETRRVLTAHRTYS
jgi:predicted HicB family RNase H-like nuclease